VTNVESMTFWSQVSSFFLKGKNRNQIKKKIFSNSMNSMIAKKKHLIYSKKKKREKREREGKKYILKRHFHMFIFLDVHASINAFSKFHTFKHAY